MSHSADSSFFASKKEWSKQKDLVLGHYLTPYIPKMATQRRPILLVDGFAGPGRFDDGEDGSPRIICNAVVNASLNSDTKTSVLLVERDPVLFGRLRKNCAEFSSFCEFRNLSFETVLPELVRKSDHYNIFVYLDPFTVKDLHLAELDKLFSQINCVKSVEVLINFNVFALGRAACSALGKRFSDTRVGDEYTNEISDAAASSIDMVLGGEWWRPMFSGADSFSAACGLLVDGYLRRLSSRFNELCTCQIKERHGHALPKYLLVFGSRHPDALELMNDGMAKSLKLQAMIEQPQDFLLFETRPKSLVPDKAELKVAILSVAAVKATRNHVILGTIRKKFGLFKVSEIRAEIQSLVSEGRLCSSSSGRRMNDDTLIWLPD